MSTKVISVINVDGITREEETLSTEKEDVKRSAVKEVCRAIGISVFGIIGFCLLFVMPWITIPRTNSIIYQAYWMEAMLPLLTSFVLGALTDILNLSTWTEEKIIMSFGVFLRVFFLNMIPYDLIYILTCMFWKNYFEANHPMPDLAYFVDINAYIIILIGLWFVLPSNLRTENNFRKKLKIYMLYCLWTQITIILKEVLLFMFTEFPAALQFIVPLMIAGCRELDKRARSKLVTKMMGEQNESASILVAINSGSAFSFFIAINLVGAEYSTMCCTLAIDLILHMKMTYKIIKENKKVQPSLFQNENRERNKNITKLVLAELIEGFTPVIYGACMAMAYYGPNAHLFAYVSNNYWGEVIEDIGPLFATMTILFAVDTLSVVFNSFCLWKFLNINPLKYFSHVLNNYWYFMAINFAFNVVLYFSFNDVNLGMDINRSFQWISEEGWVNLVNNSNDLTNKEKAELLFQTTLV